MNALHHRGSGKTVSRSVVALLTGLVLLALAGRAAGSSPLFKPPQRPDLPSVHDKSWAVNPIDAFVLARLEAAGLEPSPAADKLRLLRRVTFDLTGLPPTLDEQDAFLKDVSPDAYEKVVDRLLASPHYGERMATDWLDLVRYAETDGFKADDLRPEAHRYRDYVIRSFNADLPYDRFVRQQLAGDELEPDNADAIIATGFLRLWPDEYNAANLEQRRQEVLDDVTETTGLAVLGMTFGCARCHDHKYDPIPQADYYRLQAFFAPMRSRDDVAALDGPARKDYQSRLAAWEEATKDIRNQMDALAAGKREEARKNALMKFRAEIREAEQTSPDKRTPYQQIIALMAEQQMDRAAKDAAAKLPDDQKKRYQELEQKLAAVEPHRPQPAPLAMSVSDVGRQGPPTFRLQTGDWRKPKGEVTPGFPEFLGGGDAKPAPPPNPPPASGEGGVGETTGLRSALAEWLTRKDNSLTARVLVNRLWQHHFGVGIAATPSDFGAMGDAPTHPELLDWLAAEFVESGWGLKHVHRLMVLSAAYRQDSRADADDPRCAKALEADRDNHLLWHGRRRRLEGEEVRDAMLAATGELNARMFGVSARPKLPDRISSYAWKPDAKPEDQDRRSVYVFAKRNLRYPLFDAFDLPDMHNSCARRAVTTTAPQALLLLNGDFALERAQHLGGDLAKQFASDDALAARAYRIAWGRAATDDEIKLAVKFLEAQTAVLHSREAAVADFCHALLNTNEFLYVD